MKHQNVLRILALVMTIAMMLSVASCFGGKEQVTTPATTTPATTTPAATTPKETTPEPVVTTPEPVVTTTPEPVVTTPEPVVTTTPEPVETTPEPVVTTTPEPVETTPEPVVTTTPEPEVTTPEPGPDVPPVCEQHSYEVDVKENPARFEKTWGVCTVCGEVADEHTHKVENGKCVYCDYEFTTSTVVSKFDNDGDGNGDVLTFSAALPEKFNNALRLDAFKGSTGSHMEYDEIRAGSGKMPYAHAYCSDGVATDSLAFTVNVETAGLYELAVHIRLKDQKERGATFVINEGTAYEQKIPVTYGWASADEAILVRDCDLLQSAYYTGVSFALLAGENTITIRVAEGVAKSQHFRDLYLVMAEVECEVHSYETDVKENPARFEKTWGVCTVCGYIADEHTHKVENGVCVYCDYEFTTSTVVSKFDNDGDGNGDVLTFSAALPEKFNNALRLDAFKGSTGSHMEYDEIRAGSGKMPYAHAYCSDGVATDSLAFTVNVEKAGIYELAVHIRLKDQKERGATFIINEGTAKEEKYPVTYGWASADEAVMVRDCDLLQSAYYTGVSFALQAGENTITIRVAEGVAKSQHFRDLYLVWSADLVCDVHSYETDVKENPARFEKTWGVCTVCGYIADEHTHKVENGKCVYCDYEFTTSTVVSKFDNDGDGKGDVLTFSAALPEKFNDALRLDAFKGSTGSHMEYDEIRAGSGKMPYAHAYCSDGVATDSLAFTVNVEKAGIYELAVHIRLKDQKERGATFIINEGTANEQKIPVTYGWASADEAILVRDCDLLQSAYYTGVSFALQAGENTITIRVAEGVAKSQHFRDLYLIWSADIVCEEHSYETNVKENPARFEKTWGVCTVCGYIADEHTHKVENGKCVYCDYEFTTSTVVSKFDNDGDGNGDVLTFSAALPEKFNDALRLDAFKGSTGSHMEYDEIRAGSGKMPYAHAYCSDGVATDSLAFTVNVEKAGIYELAVHIRLKDQKERGATFIINEGTAKEEKYPVTYGWASADEAILVRDCDLLQSAYYTGVSFALQAGENTITIRVAEGVAKSQHFRDLYLVWSADLPVPECEVHSYETNVKENPARFEKTWGVCTVCGYIADEHTHKVENGKCVYCDYEFYTTDVVSKFDNDGDGKGDVLKFSAALPEKFNDALRLDAFKGSTGSHMEYDEIRAGSGKMPYAHTYCSDGVATDSLAFTVNVEKAGLYELAVHIRLKDQKERGATIIVNEGTANEQKIPVTYGWASADEAILVRDCDLLQSAYYTGLVLALQEGENTITIRVAEGVAKSQHFRDLYLVWSADLPAEEEPAGPQTLTVEEAIALGNTFEKGKYSAEYYYVTVTLNQQVNPNGFARGNLGGDLILSVAGGYLTGDAEGSIALGDTVTFLAKVGCVNSATASTGKEARLFEIQSWEIVPAN